MRLLVLAVAAILPTGSAVAPAQQTAPAPVTSNQRAQPLPGASPAQNCRRPDFRQADRNGPTQFKRLDQLPDATAYMAVYRTVDGCEEPMTVVEYRTGRR